MNGLELCRRIRERHFSSYVYLILVTSRDGTDNVVEGLNAGADDFITKPFHPAELCVRVRSGVRLLSLESRNLTIFTLAKLAESRSPETGAHLERMREYCRVLAERLSHKEKFCDEIDADYVHLIYLTSPLHDIGKVGIQDSVLLKGGPLTDKEFEIMKSHVRIGADTLPAAASYQPDAEFLRMAHDIALTHHEWYDGSGYPQGLVREEIPLCGRIVALADVYDALTAKRVYKNAFTHDVAKSVILEESGVHFDPDIVDAFLEAEQQFIDIQRRVRHAWSTPTCTTWNMSRTTSLCNPQATESVARGMSPMRIVLANPHGFCAGVVMAIRTLDRALELFGPPLYVYHEIVHNNHVVERFRRRGVIFVDTVDEVPEGGRLIYSAHGVGPQVRAGQRPEAANHRRHVSPRLQGPPGGHPLRRGRTHRRPHRPRRT